MKPVSSRTRRAGTVAVSLLSAAGAMIAWGLFEVLVVVSGDIGQSTSGRGGV